MKLTVEMNSAFQKATDTIAVNGKTVMMFTPPVGEDYWIARVRLYRNQAILAFPKFGTIGCGFALEEDWNTNLPLSCDAKTIAHHIRHNKRYAAIQHSDVVAAIKLLQEALKVKVKPELGRRETV